MPWPPSAVTELKLDYWDHRVVGAGEVASRVRRLRSLEAGGELVGMPRPEPPAAVLVGSRR